MTGEPRCRDGVNPTGMSERVAFLVTTQVTGFRGSGFRKFEEESGQEKGS
jgi:hypothetical protein